MIGIVWTEGTLDPPPKPPDKMALKTTNHDVDIGILMFGLISGSVGNSARQEIDKSKVSWKRRQPPFFNIHHKFQEEANMK